ncbi:putative Kunitz-type serine protease inhibitor [Stomoxys calcitrans]|uniref:putative Kunitz-type serine protease inhibitor n=1 Tax=Stomoxys calcitrans TaxID=35570 RepID=UPI0027E38B15|nr:putative Kunitz-type serine protease inhibitor [Stomoxys calcitrans]
MKSFICALLCLCLVVSLQAAAVEPVVEEVKTDVQPASVTVAPAMELSTDEDCHQPKETGRCYALYYRYAYDVEKRECVEFIYGGCAGNSNNFESKEACEAKCIKKSEEKDAVPAESTPANIADKTEEESTVSSTVQPPSSTAESEASS